MSAVPSHGGPPTRVLILGAGFGGLELASTLSEELGSDIDVVIVDRTDGFVFGFAKLDVMFGRRTAEEVHHAYADIAKPGVRFVQADVTAIDPDARRVETSAGSFEADVLVIALGADLDPAATPGLVEAGHEFYTEEGAFATAEVLDRFEGGRVVVGVSGTPYKCPPAPSETALLVHDHLVSRGLRERSEITLVLPLPSPVPPSPAASVALIEAFAERDIQFRPRAAVASLDPERRVAVLDNGDELPFDLYLGVPVHHAPAVVVDAGMTVDGWVPVDPLTLETRWPGVYAVGDVASVGTPKAGVFSERQASVVAGAIIAAVRGSSYDEAYDGRGICYLEMGRDNVALVEVTFVSGQMPSGSLQGPSPELAAVKAEFGTSRVARWFGRG